MNPEKYALYMLNIKHRIHHILTMDSRNADIAEIKDTGIHIAWDIELEEKALQIRKITELIASATIEIAGITKGINMEKPIRIFDEKAQEKMSKETGQKDYPYPKPYKNRLSEYTKEDYRIPTPEGEKLVVKLHSIEQYPSPEDIIAIYDNSSDIVHSNPRNTSYKSSMKHKNKIIDWTQQIMKLLDNHTIEIPRENKSYLCQLHFDKTEENINTMNIIPIPITHTSKGDDIHLLFTLPPHIPQFSIPKLYTGHPS